MTNDDNEITRLIDNLRDAYEDSIKLERAATRARDRADKQDSRYYEALYKLRQTLRDDLDPPPASHQEP